MTDKEEIGPSKNVTSKDLIQAALVSTFRISSFAFDELGVRGIISGAIEPGVRAAVAAFQKETRHEVRITFHTAPQIQKRVGSGETWDVVIAPPAAIEEFAKAGRVERERVTVGRVGLGVAVRVARHCSLRPVSSEET